MIYRILSWKECVEEILISRNEDEETFCPICFDKYTINEPVIDVLTHVKRCYFKQTIKHSVSRLNKNHTRADKILAMNDAIEEIETEINNYWLSFLSDRIDQI